MHRGLLASGICLIICSVLFLNSSASGQSKGKAVAFPSEDGFKLHGLYYAGGRSAPGILLLHQCDRVGASTGYEKLAESLSRQGFHVLILDFRGYGGSRNAEFTGQNWQQAQTFFPRDTEAAYQFLLSQPGVLKNHIGVAGASCGGRQAITLAERHPEIKTIVFVSSAIGGLSEQSFTSLLDRPILCITSENDKMAVQSMKRLFEQSQGKDSRLIVYKGSLHGTPLFNYDPGLELTIVEWFRRRLINLSDKTN